MLQEIVQQLRPEPQRPHTAVQASYLFFFLERDCDGQCDSAFVSSRPLDVMARPFQLRLGLAVM